MIKLRCLKVTDDSHFLPGDIVNVIGYSSKDGDNSGSMKIRNEDAMAVGPFQFNEKDLYMDHAKWRVLMVPNTEAVL